VSGKDTGDLPGFYSLIGLLLCCSVLGSVFLLSFLSAANYHIPAFIERSKITDPE
jgi:hypothetical protein